MAQAQFAAQAILQGAPEAFDAAFGFGRAGLEVPDAEVVQDAAEVEREYFTVYASSEIRTD